MHRLHTTFRASDTAFGIDSQLKRLQMRKPRPIRCMLDPVVSKGSERVKHDNFSTDGGI